LSEIDEEVYRGQAFYSKLTLAFYDAVVLGLSSRLVWQCPKRHLVELYRRNLGRRHLDIGVGTGHLIDRADPAVNTSITLVDLNRSSLRSATHTLIRYQPGQVVADCLRPLPLGKASVDSAGLNFLLHCIPGSMEQKVGVLGNAARCVRPGGTVFGSTILAEGIPLNRSAQRLMGLYNRKGIFHNATDSLAELNRELEAAFTDYRLTVVGCVALFEATL
jgi:ubiquinone/menaquinone biosynthesis C-methylase UbiE